MIKAQPPAKAERGHNSKVKAATVAGQRLTSFVERIEKLREEKKAIGGDERDVFAEAKGVGYDTATIRWLLKEREVDAADRDERDALRDTYAHAIGMAVDLVRVEGLSLRQAEAETGASKSSIHRALAVPALSREMTADDLGECAAARDVSSTQPILAEVPRGACQPASLQQPKVSSTPEVVKEVGAGEPRPEGTPDDAWDKADAARLHMQSLITPELYSSVKE